MDLKTEIINFREAHVGDIEQIMEVRFAVKENVLSNPSLVSYKDNEEYLTVRGKGWVCEINNSIAGFAIADLKEHSIWALFVRPEHERRGIGKKLQDIMLDWYFGATKEKLWLETASSTRAEKFYKSSGWIEVERKEKKSSSPGSPFFTEIKFEMTYRDWEKSKLLSNEGA